MKSSFTVSDWLSVSAYICCLVSVIRIPAKSCISAPLVCVYVYVYVFVCMCMCMYVYVFVCVCVRACMRACVHALWPLSLIRYGEEEANGMMKPTQTQHGY